MCVLLVMALADEVGLFVRLIFLGVRQHSYRQSVFLVCCCLLSTNEITRIVPHFSILFFFFFHLSHAAWTFPGKDESLLPAIFIRLQRFVKTITSFD